MYYIGLFLKKEFEEKELILGNFKKPTEIIYSTNILEYINYGHYGTVNKVKFMLNFFFCD